MPQYRISLKKSLYSLLGHLNSNLDGGHFPSKIECRCHLSIKLLLLCHCLASIDRVDVRAREHASPRPIAPSTSPHNAAKCKTVRPTHDDDDSSSSSTSSFSTSATFTRSAPPLPLPPSRAIVIVDDDKRGSSARKDRWGMTDPPPCLRSASRDMRTSRRTSRSRSLSYLRIRDRACKSN